MGVKGLNFGTIYKRESVYEDLIKGIQAYMETPLLTLP